MAFFDCVFLFSFFLVFQKNSFSFLNFLMPKHFPTFDSRLIRKKTKKNLFCNFSKKKTKIIFFKITNELRLLVLLRSVELRDEYGVPHNIKVQTLGTEDTWKTPSLLMVYTDNGGKIVFSQVKNKLNQISINEFHDISDRFIWKLIHRCTKATIRNIKFL